MTALTAIFALILEVLRLINRAGGMKPALEEVKKVNLSIDYLKGDHDPSDKAENISRTISGDDTTPE